MEHDEHVDPDQRDAEAAADPEPETDSTTWDTDQHSDAPGPHGTG
jgi:hypothetical protein